MGKLNQYANKSKLMDIIVKYGDEKFKFNLFQEAQINEDLIQKEIQEMPSSYGFLAVLLEKLKKKSADIETSCKRKFAELYVEYKNNIGHLSGRPPSDDYVREKININEEYMELEDELNTIREKVGLITACVKTFEQRASLIQTISANNRKLNNI